MGRKYFCDYCEKRIQNDSSIIRKHNEGLPHIRAKAEHFEQFKDLEQILAESKQKPPCRSLKDNSECMFGIICRFRHYTTEQIWEMQQRVNDFKLIQQKKSNRLHRNLRNINSRTEQFLLKRCARQRYDTEKLPPSLQAIDETELQKFEPPTWG
uniref:C3H1-type domain-containing protein n=1 Tax=Anopheles atroparvus TaxID=41427 RepID=A0AAG5DGG4_ANOAO